MPPTPSIRAQLRLFVALVLVGAGTGAVLLALAVARSVTLEETARLNAVAAVTVNATTAAADDTHDLLVSLSAMPEVIDMQSPTCGPALAEAVALLPRHVGATVTDTLGTVRCISSTDPLTVEPTVLDRVWYQEVRRRDEFVVGPPVAGRLSGTSVIVFAHPVRNDDGRTIGYLTLSSPTLERFRELVANLGDERTVVTLATESGMVVARSHDPDTWVGRMLPNSEAALADDPDARGISEAADGDGVERLWVYRNIPEYGWRVFAGVPRSDVRSRALARALPPLAVFLTLLAGLAFIMFRVRDSVDQGLTALIETMRRSSLDRSVRAPAGKGPAEVVAVAHQFNRTLTELDASLKREGEVRERLQSILNNAVFGIFLCDERGRILGCNPAMVHLLGYESEAQVTALTVADLFMVPLEAEDLLATPPETRGSAEVQWRSSQGATLPVRLNWTASVDRLGEVVIQGIAEDLSERRSLEVQVRQAQKLEAVGRLAGGVAHDFNNRLTVINGQAELLLGELEDDDSRREYVEGILTSSGRAAELTAQLLAFSRRQPVSPRRIDVTDVARNLVPMLDRILGEGVLLETFLQPTPPVYADAGQVEQILLNLATNARDAVAGQGTIRLSTRTDELSEGAAGRTESRPGTYAVLVVADDGQGMSSQIMEHIFEPFFTTKPTGKGTGLGLATVYGITTQYGGQVRVDSKPGEGTRFEVWIPAWRAPADDDGDGDRPEADLPVPSGFPPLPNGEGRAAPVRPMPNGRVGPTVLVVEDREPVRRIVTTTLTREGFRVLSAANGTAALQLARARADTLDLLITDMVMPGLSGTEVARLFRDVNPKLPVLVMTGEGEPHEAEDSDDLPVLAKPFTPADLLAQVRTILDGSTRPGPG